MDKKKCPKSLSEVAWRVDRLVQQPQNMNRFRQVLRDWYNKNAHKPEYQLLPLIEERPYSLTEKYVVLAAVHDSCCRQVEPIHPWSKVPKLSTVGVKYFGLMADVPRVLTEDDEPALESFLDSVTSDLPIKIGPAETKPEEKAKEIPSINIQNSNVIVGDVQAESLQIGDDARIDKHPVPEKPAETEQKIPPAKRLGIKALLKKVAENAWQIFTKSFWETVLERIFGPR